ncbi:MAG: bifunctional nuclease family protein [Janthinobacterium lividum]
MTEDRIAVEIESVTTSEGESGIETQFITLQDAAGRLMRVYIGKHEAKALSFGLLGFPPDRPSAYEVMLACLSAAGAVVEEIAIHDLRAQTYYAAARLQIAGQIHSIDMRPSDALNLAVRSKCPVFVSEKVFHASLPPDEPAASPETPLVTVIWPAEKLDDMSPDEVSAELAKLYAEDQSDRITKPPEQIDWQRVVPRDAARLARIKQFYRGQVLRTGTDFYHAAMVLQHAHSPEDYLLAHEFCVIAISQGVDQAKWLAAATEDRYLKSMGLPQRFGTQYETDGPNGKWSLYEVSPDLTDDMRRALSVPPLSDAQAYQGH